MNPNSTFKQRDGTEISYVKYYKDKYGVEIKNLDQPLLKHKKNKRSPEIVLIPELSKMTGMTDDMRTNFKLMKDLARYTNKSAPERLKQCNKLFQMMKNTEECNEEMKKWHIEINEAPIETLARKMDSGKLLMGRGRQIDPNSGDIDRSIQTQMLKQPDMKIWGIFYCERDERVAKQFVDTIGKSLKTFQYTVSKPAMFKVRSNNFNDWKDIFGKNLNPKVQMVVLLLPGKKINNPLYKDVKELLIGKYPIPSQVVLTNTISRGKNTISICNKILIQM